MASQEADPDATLPTGVRIVHPARWPGITLYHQWVLNAVSQPGDSGSPVFMGSSAGGIVSYSYQDEHDVWKTGYGAMAQIIARGWRPCYASSC